MKVRSSNGLPYCPSVNGSECARNVLALLWASFRADLTELHRELMLRNRKSPPKGIRPLWADKRSKNPSPSSHAKPSSGKKN